MGMQVRLDLELGKVLQAAEAAGEKAFRRAGAYLRKVARSSIKKRSGASTPGTPPNDHRGFRRTFAFYSDRFGVIVGPIAKRLRWLAALHEFGGTAKVKNRKNELVTARYPARPTMGPALEKSRAGILKMWKNIV